MNSGKVSESVLKRSVLKYVQLNNQAVENACHLITEAKVGADCALFAVSETEQDYIGTATGVSIGRHRMVVVEAIINACNNLICSGAEAFGVEIALILPETVFESELKHMMDEAKEYALAHHITILGGHTTVSHFVTETVATVAAFGKTGKYSTSFDAGGAVKSIRKMPHPGMDIVVSKWAGLQGTAKLAVSKEEELMKRLPGRMLREAATYSQYMSIVPEARIALKEGARLLHDVSGGGMFRALWELAELAGTGLRVDLKKIPIKQETIEICEVFGLNPYELLSGGSLLMVTEDGESLAEKLWEADIPAAVIGKLTDNNDRVILTHWDGSEELRYLERPKTDEIDKI